MGLTSRLLISQTGPAGAPARLQAHELAKVTWHRDMRMVLRYNHLSEEELVNKRASEQRSADELAPSIGEDVAFGLGHRTVMYVECSAR